jgi:hypothetical protein
MFRKLTCLTLNRPLISASVPAEEAAGVVLEVAADAAGVTGAEEEGAGWGVG